MLRSVCAIEKADDEAKGRIHVINTDRLIHAMDFRPLNVTGTQSSKVVLVTLDFDYSDLPQTCL